MIVTHCSLYQNWYPWRQKLMSKFSSFFQDMKQIKPEKSLISHRNFIWYTECKRQIHIKFNKQFRGNKTYLWISKVCDVLFSLCYISIKCWISFNDYIYLLEILNMSVGVVLSHRIVITKLFRTGHMVPNITRDTGSIPRTAYWIVSNSGQSKSTHRKALRLRRDRIVAKRFLEG